MSGLAKRLMERVSATGHKWRYRPPLTGPAIPASRKSVLCNRDSGYAVPSRNGGRYVVRWTVFGGRTVEYEPPD